IPLYKEPLYASVARYHSAYDPSSDEEDPLSYYGASGGELPSTSMEATEILRDAVIRYQQPHRQFLWDRLSDLIAKVAGYDAELVVLVSRVDPLSQSEYFNLSLSVLAEVANTVVAVQQILDALHTFLRRDKKSAFVLDPNYGFLYMLEKCASEFELRFALSSLQLRLTRADKHIRSYLQGIRTLYTGTEPSETISSVDSTISEVREAFGSEPPTKELYRLLLRKDYGQR
ncbi:hypothetical protein B0H15DRAFT_745164, partial [Mycena belliarum]